MAWCEKCGSLTFKKDAKGMPVCTNPHCKELPTKTEKDSIINPVYAKQVNKIEEKIRKYEPIYSDEIFEFKKLLDDKDVHERVRLDLERIVNSREYAKAVCESGSKHVYIYGADPEFKEGIRTYSLNTSVKNVVCNKQKDCVFTKKNVYHCIFYALAQEAGLAKQIIKNKRTGILLS